MTENISKNHKSKTVPFILVITLMVLSFVAGTSFSTYNFVSSANPEIINTKDDIPEYLNKSVDFNLYWDVMDILKNKYIDSDKILDTELFYGSLAGMVASLGDPYSVFLTPQVNKEFTEELSGNFQGIGAEIGLKKGILTIIAPLPGTPAEKAGLQPRDQVLAIDGVSTSGMGLDESVSRIRGEGGTEVVLTILSPDSEESRDVTIVRDVINIVSVSWSKKENNTAYIKLSYFNQDTEQQFRAVAKEVLASNPDQIILDVRNNPGGFLDVAILIASYWIEDDVIVQERFSDGTIDKYQSRGKPIFSDIPTVVLINEGSASASEIVAGALSDYGKAALIGMQSFGKGSVQDLIELSDGSSVKITIAKWLTPKGTTIDKEGLKPDIEVDLTKEDYDEDRDPQLDAAIQFFK